MNDITEEKLTKQFSRILRILAKQVVSLIGHISSAKESGTPYYDDIIEHLENLLWQIKIRERKYKKQI